MGQFLFMAFLGSLVIAGAAFRNARRPAPSTATYDPMTDPSSPQYIAVHQAIQEAAESGGQE